MLWFYLTLFWDLESLLLPINQSDWNLKPIASYSLLRPPPSGLFKFELLWHFPSFSFLPSLWLLLFWFHDTQSKCAPLTTWGILTLTLKIRAVILPFRCNRIPCKLAGAFGITSKQDLISWWLIITCSLAVVLTAEGKVKFQSRTSERVNWYHGTRACLLMFFCYDLLLVTPIYLYIRFIYRIDYFTCVTI